MYLYEELHFRGTLTALGGSTHMPGYYRYGGPGTVYIHSTVGEDVTTELWVDNVGRGCIEVIVDTDRLTYLKLFRKACVTPSQVGGNINP